MPELPEVETVCRGMAAALEGHRLTRVEVRRPDLRFPLPPDLGERMGGRRVVRVWRRAKYFQIGLDDNQVMLGHLGMSGRIVISPAAPNDLGPHDHILFHVDTGAVLRFTDPRRFGMVDITDQTDLASHKWLAGLGPEPLEAGFGPDTLLAAAAGRRTSLKALLLDQQVVAGLGNIYVCEALYHARLDPRREAGSLTPAEAKRLAKAIRSVLTRAIAAGGSSLRDHVQTNGELGYFQHEWAVYGKEGEACPACTCGQGISRIVQSNRSTFYCAHRQR
ncbi:MAG: bifunctional DNA-formamidopyrimidine glycosylase/DNA-(apurinic or apyrimidinic site) lyase [Alphaproteobacteria bacterium]|nr:bifunctional DNA-formamidopyrimidine glycosylase/DNA-(apurinic or apyrimidinic site) lyase [Alphaproteobacteria bacterium]